MRNNKRMTALVMATVFAFGTASTAFAGTWSVGAGDNQNKWWYDNGDGTYVQNSWQWIDGNGDGIAESYYFDANGWLLTNTTTPDGYTVNANGAWVENGVVKTQNVAVETNSSTQVVVGGDYNYYMSALYVKNEQTGSYELHKETKKFDKIVDYSVYENEVWSERGTLGLVADLTNWNLKIEIVGDNDVALIDDNTSYIWHFAQQAGEWAPIYYEWNGEVKTGDFSNSSTFSFAGDTLEIINRLHIENSEDYSEGNILSTLGGKDVMYKEIYKKK